ncbi:zinc finger protein 878-like [Phlebotomus argentipes]|uniref:zinc finger protein 878-like n=1 Tax=Phlebotomus argentipes TaxID=94469 RepID=UPI00289337CE|nr:zinc finger protein 878-like [Phlebotomus argentipes]
MESAALAGKCRACRIKVQGDSQVFIFASTNLPHIFQEATSLPIHENDGLPGVLCASCYNRLLETYNFRKMCASTALEFHQILSMSGEVPFEEKYMPPEGLAEPKSDVDDVADSNSFDFPPESKFNPDESVDPLAGNRRLSEATSEDADDVPLTARKVAKKRVPKTSVKDEDVGEEAEVKEERSCFECELCKRRFRNKFSLESHMRRVHQGLKKGNVCPICDKAVCNPGTLKWHMARKHDVKSEFGCNYPGCFRQYECEKALLKHMQRCHDPDNPKPEKQPPKQSPPKESKPKNYTCKLCDSAFITPKGLGMHRAVVHGGVEQGVDNEGKPFKLYATNRGIKPSLECEICGRKFFKKLGLESHIRRIHQGMKKGTLCPLCNKEYSRPDSLKWHMSRKHGVKSPFTCDYPECFRVYECQESLTYHMSRHHNPKKPKPPPKKHICEVCGKFFPSSAGLKKHSYSHSGPESRPFGCSMCSKRFVTDHKMKVHMMRHEGIKNHECTICGMRKVTARELKIHMNYHTRETVWPCKLCPLISSSRENMKRHVKVVHQGIKSFPCPHCERSFGKSETLKHHVMTHTGEKPHACDVCGKRFIQPTALKTHMKTHLRTK